ncbi:DUF1080 domain-containing protein [Persicitalea sp.]|uniref:3-keto-disaccharide hydrolase n=1 Tax=Persicitalea sp. TaxID=3100273 RepID=UPI0035930A81
MKYSVISTFARFTIFAFSTLTAHAQTPRQILKNHGWQRQQTTLLLSEKNFDGWYTFLHDQGRDRDPDHVFTLDNGVLHITGAEFGSLTTEREYENYELTLEYKWGNATHAPRADAARDNGVFIHSVGKDGAYAGNWMHAIECQIIEGGTGDFLVVGDGSDDFAMTSPVVSAAKAPYYFKPDGDTVSIHRGRINWYGRDPTWKDVKGFRGAKDLDKPLGEWNRIRILAIGEEVYYFVNGGLANHALHVKPAKGRIQIQSEGAEIFVRKVEMTPLVRK